MGLGAKLNINPILCAATLALAIAAGWALKRVHGQARYCQAAFSLLLLHGVLGLLRFAKPNDGAPQGKTSWQAAFNVQLMVIPLAVIADAHHGLRAFRSELFYVALAISLVASLVQWQSRVFLRALAVNVSVIWNVALLVKVVLATDDCYWTPGFVLLVVLNHFLLRHLALYYEISQLEISSVGLCFFVIFALNSINELEATIR